MSEKPEAVFEIAEMVRLETLDWVMSGPVEGQGSLAQRGIQLTGSVHTHDELVYREGEDVFLGSAETPHFRLVPFEERLAEVKRGERVMAVFRLDLFEMAPEFSEILKSVRTAGAACLMGADVLQIPYDKKAIESHARNWIRAKVRRVLPDWLDFLVRPVTAHVEYMVYCTESCFGIVSVAGRAVGINLDLNGRYLKTQPLVAPVHAEQLYRMGILRPIADWGLLRRLDCGDK